ncbi:hypothetical protein GQ457_09G005420 [Hibiscus cannabinus]
MHSHLGAKGKPSIHVHTPEYSPLREYLSEGSQRKSTAEKWEAILRDLRSEDIIWRVYWLDHTYILYRCGVFDWVPLLGLWGATGYAPLLVSRQYGSRQFVPATRGLGLCEFVFEGDKNKKKIVEIANAWLYPYQAKLAAPKLTVDYEIWRTKRKNCKIPSPSRGKALTLEEHFKVIPTEVEIVRQECEEEKQALNKRIAELEARNQELDHGVTYYQGQSDMFEKELNRVNVDFKDLKALKDALQQHKDLIDELQESMKMNDDNWYLQLKFARGDIKVREDLMGEALIQIRRVAECVTSLAKEAERLKFWINPSTHFAEEWMEFLRMFKQLGERARSYRRVWF